MLNLILLTTISAGVALLLCFVYNAKKRTHGQQQQQVPGPLALPVIGHLHLIRANLQQSFHNLSQCYGPIFQLRLGGSRRCVVVSCPELAKEFLKAHDLTFAYRNHTPAIKLLTYDASFAFAPYGPYMRFMKKMCTYKLLGTRNLNAFEPVRTLEIHRFLHQLMLKAEAGQPANLTKSLMKLASNIISQMTWSARCAESEVDAETARTVVREVSQIFGEFYMLSDIIWFCKNMDLQGIWKRAQSTHERYDALLEKIITERETERRTAKTKTIRNTTTSARSAAEDFLDMLLNIMENDDDQSEVKVSRNHIKAIILDLLTAATDTIAIILEWALSELINNPRVLKKAQDEINEIVGTQRLAKESDIPHLPYIKAVIKEAFRLHPPNPMLIRCSINDSNVAGYHIPAETTLFVNIWSFGKNPKYWENPSEFRPERFLETESENPLSRIDMTGQHFELLPFGTGRRGCPGMPLAMTEVPTILTLLIQCFEYVVPSLESGKAHGTGVNFIDMDERPGLTAPRANDLVLLPNPRIDLRQLLPI